ncbi:MAG: hypothetical protein P8I97_02355 [Verrucomicrobiales bacterium]|nr:hypothetical protein [Verrucomicrobiales bacterium]
MPDQRTEPHKIGSSKILKRRLARARRSIVAVEFYRRTALTIAIILGLFSALLFIDLIYELEKPTRKTSLNSIQFLLGACGLWTMISLITQRKNDEELALNVEKHYKNFDSRLISSIQFHKGKATIPENAPLGMIHSMIREAETESARFKFNKIVNFKKTARAALLLLIVLSTSGGWAFLNRESVPTLLERAFGKEIAIPRDTRIIKIPQINKVGIGDDVAMEFFVETKKSTELKGVLKIHYSSNQKINLTLNKDENIEGKYSAIIKDVPESFSYNASIDDARTADHEVTAFERPQIKGLTATQKYPEFTKQESSEHVPGDFTFFPGSTVTLNISSTKSLKSGSIRFIEEDKGIPLIIDSANESAGSITFTVPSNDLSGFSVSLIDQDDMESFSNSIYKVTLLSDLAPQIRITYPKRAEELVTRKAKFLIKYEANDRFGIAAVNLHYQRIGSEPSSISITDLKTEPKKISDQFDWDLSSLNPGLAEGDEIEYWLEALDQNTAGPNIGKTERLLLRVVTPEEKRADLLGRTSDALGSVDEATTDQEILNKDLETIIRKNSEKPTKED